MSRRRDQPLDEVTFRCRVCREVFTCAPGEVRDAPANEHHPWEYSAACPNCGATSDQAYWEKALLKAWSNATGPKTAEGIAATAKNLEGHPTPEEAKRTRFNAMKHGLAARTATYFPAKPDGYAFCKACDVDRFWCGDQPACVKQTQIFLQHHAAFETRNPKHLTGIYADLQGAIMAVLQQILQTIIADGVKITSPQWYTDKETGRLVIAEYVDEDGHRRVLTEIEAHPLFKPLGELLSRNSLSLQDMGMTAKVIEEEEQEMGRLQVQEGAQQALADFSQQQAESLNALRAMMERAVENRKKDPILVEYQQQNCGE